MNEDILAFRRWLAKRPDITLQAQTNPWELLRFKREFTTGDLLGIVYRNKRERRTFVGEAERLWKEFREGKPAEVRPGALHTDGLMVTPDEALELFCHHMKLACTFFETLGEDTEAEDLEELRRLCSEKRDRIAVEAAFQALTAYYNDLKKGD